jgi:hypothetical protein
VFTAVPQTITGTALSDLPVYSAEFLGAAGWTSVDWTGDWATGWKHTTGNTTALSQSTAAVVGTKYLITFTVTERTAGTFTISFGGQTWASTSTLGITASGIFGPTATTIDGLSITPSSLFDGKIILSIKSITGSVSPVLILKSSDGATVVDVRANINLENTFYGLTAGSYTTGVANTGIGVNALQQNTSGTLNIAIGGYSLLSNTVGWANTAIGGNSLRDNISGYANLAMGFGALRLNTTGYLNVGFGYQALFSNLVGHNNVAVGYGTLYSNTGYQNTGIGNSAGLSLTSGNSNVFIGYYAGRHASQKVDAVNSMALGNGAYTTADNQVVIGNTSVTAVTINGVITTSNSPIIGGYTILFPATGTVAMLNQANSFTLINPLTTIAESWIGPSSTTGIYFKGGFVGIGITTPLSPLQVGTTFGISGANIESNLYYSGGWKRITAAAGCLIDTTGGAWTFYTTPTGTVGSAAPLTNVVTIGNTGIVTINASSTATADFYSKTDNYDAIFVDASNESIVIMSNAAGMVGFFGATAVVRPSAYTLSNVAADRAFDAHSTTLDEIADVLGTVINDLKALGLVA